MEIFEKKVDDMKKRLVRVAWFIVALLCSSLLPAAAAEETDLLVNGGLRPATAPDGIGSITPLLTALLRIAENYCAISSQKQQLLIKLLRYLPDTKYVFNRVGKI